MGFVRRFPSNPGSGIITQIEGVAIIDNAQPGTTNGVGTGRVALVGEFADMSASILVDTAGAITTRATAVQVFSFADLLTKLGGWDETLGEFGGDLGNGFVALRNKRFASLVCVPVDLVSNGTTCGGTRYWRDLPTNKSVTDPTPIVPISPGVIVAGRQFFNAANTARVAQRITFADNTAYATGTNGDVTTAAAAAVQNFDRLAGSFVTDAVAPGDILVSSVIGGAGAIGANAFTLRVVSVTSATRIVVERLDGTNFAFTTLTNVVWRIHTAATADSGSAIAGTKGILSAAGQYVVPARPLVATIAAAALLTPSTAPAAGTANSWDSLSGLGGRTHPTIALTYLAAVHAPNAVNSATMDARYAAAIEALLNDADPTREVRIVYAARKSSLIRSNLRTHVGVASERGMSRRAVISPEVNTLTLAAVLGSADPGVGANRSDRIDYSWPGARTSVPEAVGFSIATADGKTTTDGILDETFDGFLAALESNLPPENNPGQAAAPVPVVLSGVLGFQRGAPNLTMAEYIQFRASGIAALKMDRVSGPIIQSGITSSLTSGEKNIYRRRMADFIQDSCADLLDPLSKLPQTQQRKDDATAAVESFLSGLLSENDPSAQRISDYNVDSVSGNTPELEALGVFVLVITVRLLSTMDFIVLNATIGENVSVSTAEAA